MNQILYLIAVSSAITLVIVPGVLLIAGVETVVLRWEFLLGVQLVLSFAILTYLAVKGKP